MKNERISELFLRNGEYHFSRWSKPVAPVIFGVDDESLVGLKSGFYEVLSLASLELADFDPNLGANLLVFFCSDWSELGSVPKLGDLISDLNNLLKILNKKQANQYRTFSFANDGSINLVVLLLRYDKELSSVSTQTLSVSQMLQSVLLWSPDAFKRESPISITEKTNRCIVKPFYQALIKAAYDPVLPVFSTDKSHAMRLEARVSLLLEEK